MSKSRLSLSELSSKSGSNKHVYGFTDFYERFLHEIKPRVVCEIGMGGLIPPHWPEYQLIESDNPGGSSRMWLKYFPDAKVYVLDNFSQVSDQDVERVIAEVEKTSNGRYKLVEGDQASREDLQKYIDTIEGDIDFLVDDGGHQMQQQQLSLAMLFPKIKSGGLYSIEDLHTSNFTQTRKWGVYPDGSNSTLRLLEKFKTTGKIESMYMSESEKKYLEENITFCEIYKNPSKPFGGTDEGHITSMLGKK